MHLYGHVFCLLSSTTKRCLCIDNQNHVIVYKSWNLSTHIDQEIEIKWITNKYKTSCFPTRDIYNKTMHLSNAKHSKKQKKNLLVPKSVHPWNIFRLEKPPSQGIGRSNSIYPFLQFALPPCVKWDRGSTQNLSVVHAFCFVLLLP